MSENVMSVTDGSFDAEVLQSEVPVLVDFWASWCGPCKMMGGAIEEVAAEFAGKAKVVKLDVDENSETSGKYNIRGVPTLTIFKNGEVVASKTGAMTKVQLAEFINANS